MAGNDCRRHVALLQFPSLGESRRRNTIAWCVIAAMAFAWLPATSPVWAQSEASESERSEEEMSGEDVSETDAVGELPENPNELQFDDDGYLIERQKPMLQERVKSAVSDGPGIIGNIGFLGLPTFGRDDSIAPVEIMPYLLLDNDFFFSDIRGFISTEGHFGGNFGVGYRRLVPNQHAWYGVNAWYDVDDSSTQLYHQLGFGVEAAFKSFEFRSNAYFPVGDTEQTLETGAVNPRFVGRNIVFDQYILTGQALRGADVEVGYVLPLPKLGETSELRWYVGGYFFAGSGDSDGITGVQTRAEAQLASAVTTHLQFSNDEEFGSNVMVGLSLDLPYGESHPTSSWRRNTPSPFRYVHRNYNIILDRRDDSELDVVAVNPLTGEAYDVAHVDSNADGIFDGNVNNPYETLAAAQASGADIIFVHSGSVLNESVVLGDNVRLIGDSGQHWIDLPQSRTALMPTLNAGGGAAPRITGVTGNAITLGSGSYVSGFQIDNITGNGIVGNGIAGGGVRNVTFNEISGDAIRLTDTSGNLFLRDLAMTDIGGSGLVINGGTANIDVQTASMTNVDGDGIRLLDIDDGEVRLRETTIENVGQHGLVMTNVNADVRASNLTIKNSGETAIEINGGEGLYEFSGETLLENVDGGFSFKDSLATLDISYLNVMTTGNEAGLTLEDLTGELTIDRLDIDATDGPGAVIRNVDDLVISGGILSTEGAAAFDAEDSNVAVILQSVSVDGGPVGIRLDHVTGSFAVVSKDQFGGEIKNTDVAVLLNEAGTVSLQNMDLIDNTTGIQSTGSDLLAIGGMVITGSTEFALDSRNDKLLSVRSSAFADNGEDGGATIRVQADTKGTYRSEFISNAFSDNTGTSLLITSLSGAAGSALDTTLVGNSFESSVSNHSIVDINWNGPASVAANGNVFALSGSSVTALDIKALSTTEALSGTIVGNTFQLTGTNTTAVNIEAGEDSSLQLQQNTVAITGTGATAFRFDLTGATTMWLNTNRIESTGAGTTGMYFENVGDKSRLQLDGNNIVLQSTSATIDRGIIFNEIVGDDTQFFGTTNNVITGASEVLFVPTGSASGKFYVNGVAVP